MVLDCMISRKLLTFSDALTAGFVSKPQSFRTFVLNHDRGIYGTQAEVWESSRSDKFLRHFHMFGRIWIPTRSFTETWSLRMWCWTKRLWSRFIWLVLSWLFQVICWIIMYTLQYTYTYIIHCIIPMIGPRLVCLAALNDTKVEHVNASIRVSIFQSRVRSSFRRQGYVKIIDFGVGYPEPPVPLVSPTTWVYPFSTVIHLYNTYYNIIHVV